MKNLSKEQLINIIPNNCDLYVLKPGITHHYEYLCYTNNKLNGCEVFIGSSKEPIYAPHVFGIGVVSKKINIELYRDKYVLLMSKDELGNVIIPPEQWFIFKAGHGYLTNRSTKDEWITSRTDKDVMSFNNINDCLDLMRDWDLSSEYRFTTIPPIAEQGA